MSAGSNTIGADTPKSGAVGGPAGQSRLYNPPSVEQAGCRRHLSKRRQQPEEALHVAVVRFLRLALPAPWIFWHTPNGGLRHKVAAAKLKAFGTLAGIPDLFVAGPAIHGGVRLIGLELKASKGSLTDEQKLVMARLDACGAENYVCRSAEDVELFLRFGSRVPLKATTGRPAP